MNYSQFLNLVSPPDNMISADVVEQKRSEFERAGSRFRILAKESPTEPSIGDFNRIFVVDEEGEHVAV